MKAITLAVLALTVSLSATPQTTDQLMTSFVTSGESAYYVAPPRLVVEGDSLTLFFTPDGKYGIISGLEPPKTSAEQQLKSIFDPSLVSVPNPWIKVWDTENNVVRPASPAIADMLSEWGNGFESGLEWTSKSGVAIATFVLGNNGSPRGLTPTAAAIGDTISPPSKTGIYRVNFAEGTVTQLLTLNNQFSRVRLMASPTRPVFVVFAQSMNAPLDRADLKTTVKFQAYDLAGKPLKSGQSEIQGNVFFDEWTADGGDLLGRAIRRLNGGAKAISSRLVLNLTTGSINETKEDLKVYGPIEKEPPFTEQIVYGQVKNGDARRNVSTLWLNSSKPSEEPACMVATGVGQFHWLSPRLNLIAYVANGALYASEIVKMDIDEFHKLKAEAQKRQAMSNAKQMAVAMQIYAADSDDYMPLSDSYTDSVYPYVKNRDVMNGFIYTYKGGPLSGLKDPAGTEIGYISVNGGRAVAYADGHVGFVKGP